MLLTSHSPFQSMVHSFLHRLLPFPALSFSQQRLPTQISLFLLRLLRARMEAVAAGVQTVQSEEDLRRLLESGSSLVQPALSDIVHGTRCSVLTSHVMPPASALAPQSLVLSSRVCICLRACYAKPSADTAYVAARSR